MMLEYAGIYFVIGLIVALLAWKFCANNPNYEMSNYTLRAKMIIMVCIFLCWPITLIVTAYDQYKYRKGE